MPPNPSPRGVVQYWQHEVYFSSGSYATSQTVTGSIVQLSRIQDVSFSLPYPIEETMYMDGGYDSYLTHATQPTLNLRWFNTNSENERWVGLMNTLAPSGTLGFDIDSEKNVYITTENSLVDAVGATGYGQTKTVIGLGQCLLTQYQLSASVGGLVTADASFISLTAYVNSGQSGNQVPSVNYQDGMRMTGLYSLPAASSQYVTSLPSGTYPTGIYANEVAAISANDLIMTFPQGSPFGVVLTGFQSCYLQSFSLALGINRQEIKPLGNVYPQNRGVLYPITVDLSTEAIVSSYQADALQRIGCLMTGQTNEINVIVKQPCSNATMFGFYFDNLQLESQQFVTTIGRNDVVSLKWRGIITTPNQPFFNPFINFIYNADTTGAWGTKW